VPRIHARDLGRRGPITPFTRLARTHALSVAGDALFAIGLAGTVFFSTDPNQARWKVALYLVLTVAPFAVAAPLIGPALDRRAGGRRWVVFGSAAARALLAVLLARDLDSIWFYPEAFLMLVLAKVHLISKSALVPTTVRTDEELVEANSKLSLLGALAVVGAAVPGLILLKAGPPWVLALAAVVFVFTALQAFALPDTTVADKPPDAAEKAELRSVGIVLAASSMGLVRGIVGFLTFLLAFDFKNGDRPLWWLGIVAVFAQIGFFLGAVVAPKLRRRWTEERMITLSIAATVVLGLLAAKIVDTDELWAISGLLAGAALLSFGVGLSSSTAKQGFDALVQRDAPDANRGRSFAKFETRFQLIWVIGAFLPVVFPIPILAGFLVIVAVAAFALVSYWVGQRQIAAAELGHRPPPDPRSPAVGLVGRAVERRRARASEARREAASGGEGDQVPVLPVDPEDPTLHGRPGPGLFGQPDEPIPEDLLDTPPAGLFGVDAPTEPTVVAPAPGGHHEATGPSEPFLAPAGAEAPRPAAPSVSLTDETLVEGTLPFPPTALPASAPAPPKPSWAPPDEPAPIAPATADPPPPPSWVGSVPSTSSTPSSDLPAPADEPPTHVAEPSLPFADPVSAPAAGEVDDAPTRPSIPTGWDAAEPRWRS
jgi:hypothetical protein